MANRHGMVNSNYGWQWNRQEQLEMVVTKLKVEKEERKEKIKKKYYRTPSSYRRYAKSAESDDEFNKRLQEDVKNLKAENTSQSEINDYVERSKFQREKDKRDLVTQSFNEQKLWEKEQVKLYKGPAKGQENPKLYNDLSDDIFDIAYYLADDEFKQLEGMTKQEYFYGPIYGMGLSQEIIDKNKPEIVSLFRIDDKMDVETVESKLNDVDKLIKSLNIESTGTAGGKRKSLRGAIKELKETKGKKIKEDILSQRKYTESLFRTNQ